MFDWWNKHKKPAPMPLWTKALLAAFVVYVFIAGVQRDKTAEPSKMQQAVGNIHKEVSGAFNVREYAAKILPNAGSTLRVKEIAPGAGAEAVCGQDATVAYRAYRKDGSLIEERSLTFRIGGGDSMPALEMGAIGMKPGGKRSLLASADLAYGSPASPRAEVADSMVRLDIDMIKASPSLPDAAAAPYRVAEIADGSGNTVLCGQAVRANVTVWSAEGKKLFAAAEPLSFTPGKAQVFFGLEQGVIGMRRGGSRLLVVPPSFQKPLHGGKTDIPLPKSQTVLVDVEVLP